MPETVFDVDAFGSQVDSVFDRQVVVGKTRRREEEVRRLKSRTQSIFHLQRSGAVSTSLVTTAVFCAALASSSQVSASPRRSPPPSGRTWLVQGLQVGSRDMGSRISERDPHELWTMYLEELPEAGGGVEANTSREVLRFWRRLTSSIGPDFPLPQASPTEEGSLQLVWDAGERTLEVEIGPEIYEVFEIDHATGASETREYADLDELLAAELTQLADLA